MGEFFTLSEPSFLMQGATAVWQPMWQAVQGCSTAYGSMVSGQNYRAFSKTLVCLPLVLPTVSCLLVFSVCLPIHSCVHYPTIHPPICPSTSHTPVFTCTHHPPMYPSLHPYIYPLTITFSIYSSIYYLPVPSTHLCIHPSSYSPVPPSIYPYIHPSVHCTTIHTSLHPLIHHPAAYSPSR